MTITWSEKINDDLLENDLLKFYIANDKNFTPPLSEQVSIPEYIEKIKNNAVCFEARDRKVLIGLIAAYFNNNDTGFITSVITIPNYQGRGIAQQLLQNCFSYAKKSNFKKIELEVFKHNTPAISLYKKNGFSITGENENQFKMEKIVK